MIQPPKPVETLPSLEHNGVEIVCRIHHGFSMPAKGNGPAPRYLYGAVSPQGERHWRRNLSELEALIDAGFNAKDDDGKESNKEGKEDAA